MRVNRSILAAIALAAFAAFSPAEAHTTWAEIYAGQPVTMATPPVPQPRRAGRVGRSAIPAARGEVQRLITAAASRHGVPHAAALRIAHVESGFRCNARGRAGELGPLQIKPATARGLGYRGPASALASCGAGLEWGMRHLSVAYRRCGTVAGMARLHNRGLGASCSGGGRYVTTVMRRA